MTEVDKSDYDPRKCQVQSRRTGKQCGNFTAMGTNVCRMHGAGNRQSKEKHKRDKEEARLRRVAQRLGTPVEDTDPGQVLLDQVASKAAEVEWLKRQVELISNDEEMFWGMVQSDDTRFGIDVTYKAGMNVIYQTLHKAQDQLVKYASETLRAGVEERQVRAAERTGEQFEAVLMAVLSAINATPQQMQLASTEVPRILMDMSGGKK